MLKGLLSRRRPQPAHRAWPTKVTPAKMGNRRAPLQLGIRTRVPVPPQERRFGTPPR